MSAEMLSPRRKKERLVGGGPMYISHEQREPQLATTYLRESGADDQLIQEVFTPSGEWKVTPYQDTLENKDSLEATATILQRSADVYRLAQISLEGINWFGYNDHGPAHLKKVTDQVGSFTKDLAISERVKRTALFAAAGHDLGNLVSRDIHSFISPTLYERMFPHLLGNPEDLKAMNTAIILHDDIAYQKVITALQNQGLSNAGFVSRFGNIVGPESLLLLLADKGDIGRHRVNKKAINRPAIDRHAHSEINLLFATGEMNFDGGDGSFNWNIRFDQQVTDAEKDRFHDLLIEDADTQENTLLYASPRVKNDPNDTRANFHKSKFLLLNRFANRITIAMLSAFALNHAVSIARLQIIDQEPGVTIEFHRQNVTDELKEFAEQYK